MKRPIVVALGLTLLMLVGATAFCQEPAAKAADRYAAPAGGVAEQLKFIESLSQFRPGSLEDDYQHRARFRPALQQAAERILALEKDRSSEAYQAAELIVLANRARWLAQVDPDQQKKVVADVKAHLKRKIAAGESRQAVNLAVATGRVLLAAGRIDLAVEASNEVAELLRQSGEPELRELANRVEDTVRAVAPIAKDVRPENLKLPPAPKGRLVPLDLQAKANRQTNDLSVSDNFPGNGLAELGLGDKVLGGVRFRIGSKLIQLAGGSAEGVPKEVEGIAIDRKVARLFVLQAAQWSAADDASLGQYTVRYEDGSTAQLPVVYGKDLRDWWASDMGRPVTRGRVVWTGSNRACEGGETMLRLYLGTWENPHPEKKVGQIDFSSTESSSAPFCVAITVEEPQ